MYTEVTKEAFDLWYVSNSQNPGAVKSVGVAFCYTCNIGWIYLRCLHSISSSGLWECSCHGAGWMPGLWQWWISTLMLVELCTLCVLYIWDCDCLNPEVRNSRWFLCWQNESTLTWLLLSNQECPKNSSRICSSIRRERATSSLSSWPREPLNRLRWSLWSLIP